MRSVLVVAAAVSAALWSAPAWAGAGNFTLVNGTGRPITAVGIRRVGTDQWQSLAVAPPAGARAFVAFADPDCAFDIRASVAGQTIVWAGVNLCDTKSVTLNRNESGAVWVDYD